MERRTFIKSTIATMGAMAVGNTGFASPSLASADEKQASGLRRSIMWGTIGLQGSILEKCKAVKAAGFDGVEPNSHTNRQEMIDAIKAAGLVASSVCNSKHWDLTLSHPEVAVRQQGIEAMIVAMEDAKAYGTDAVLLVPGVVSDTVGYDECWKRSTECIRELLPAAEEMKVKICIENVWNNFLLSPLEAARYVDQFESRYVKFYFDCGNILNYGFPDQWIKILGHRIGRIHIKEFSKKKADTTGKSSGFDVKLTEGDVPWAPVIKQILSNYEGGWLTTEMGTGESADGLKDLLQRLDKIIAMGNK
ncbi:MAG: sugar phosphate isomerase/epimerase [Tannerella sp.]|jgi:hexulose-6-phosphate isomerase|nr:sugar phosphate isomerase/epimerase [Tannerella sp.]